MVHLLSIADKTTEMGEGRPQRVPGSLCTPCLDSRPSFIFDVAVFVVVVVFKLQTAVPALLNPCLVLDATLLHENKS